MSSKSPSAGGKNSAACAPVESGQLLLALSPGA
jgi:hypothetical protein